ncbi:MAG: taurine dioxygenase [Rhodospirillales bacterium]|jgi:taurine dioxygenase|nr:taurine dioxygenase [Rhodospirillales bacterium]
MSQRRNSISIHPLNPVIGAELHGFDLREDLSGEDVQAIQDALNTYQVVFFRDQDITPEQHLAFGRRFGELHVHPSVRGKPRSQWSELLAVHADATTGRVAGDKWHTDVSCDEKPPLSSILHLTTIPDSGGDTLFSSMYAAYEALSEPMKQMLDGLTATHDGAPNYGDRERRNRKNNPDRVDSVAVHPVIATHPSTGRKTIYVNSAFTVRINELNEAESEAILRMLFAHVTRPEFQCRFHWQRNSIAFWDNRAVQHYAVWDYYPAVRSGQRVTIRGDRPS